MARTILRRSTDTAIAFAVLAMVHGSCTVGDDYAPPKVDLPTSYRDEEAAAGESVASLPWPEIYPDPVLQELIRESLLHNRDLLVAVERIDEARARVGIARADLWPMFAASASAGSERASAESPPAGFPSNNLERNVYGLGASMRWEIDLFGRIRRASEAQQAQLLAAEYTRRAIVLALVADVSRAYVELRDFDRRLDIMNQTVSSRRAYLELVRVRFEGGLTSELDLRQAEAELHRTESQAHEFERLQVQKENELNLLLGRNPQPIPRGKLVAELPRPEVVPAGLPSDLLLRRPDLAAAEQALVASNARVGEAKALLYPSFSLTGFLGFQSTELSDLANAPARTFSLSADVLQPIFNSGQLQGRVEVAEAQARQVLLGYEQAILAALRDVEDSLVRYRKFGDRRATEALRVAAQQKVLDLAEIRYRGDVSPYLDVLDAQRQLLDAELNEASAIRDEYLALILLYKSIGGGFEP